MSANPGITAAPPRFALRMWAFFAGYFVVGGVTVPFFPVWLEARGLTDAEIANCIAIPIIIRVLLTPFAGMFADKAPNRRFAIRIFVIAGAGIFLLAWPAHSYLALLLVTGTAFVLWGMALPVAEALALTGVRRFGLDYGRMRLGGSVAFIVTNLGSGAILALLVPEAIFWFVATALGLSVVAAFSLPVTPPAVRALDDAERPPPKPVRALFGRPDVLTLMLVGGLIQASHAVLYSFGSIYWQKLGYSSIDIGAFWATGVICEIALFTWSTAAIRAFGPVGLIVLGAVAAVLRWSLFPFDLGFLGFAAVQVLHAFTFGATYIGNQHAIANCVPEEMTATAQGLFGMISGVILAIATAASGPLYNNLGADAFYVMIVLPLLALAILPFHLRMGAKAAPL